MVYLPTIPKKLFVSRLTILILVTPPLLAAFSTEQLPVATRPKKLQQLARPSLEYCASFPETGIVTMVIRAPVGEEDAQPLIKTPKHALVNFKRNLKFSQILLKLWSGKRGSNPRPRPWQGRALPLSYSRTLYSKRQLLLYLNSIIKVKVLLKFSILF